MTSVDADQDPERGVTPSFARGRLAILAACVGLVSTCGIVYQLVVATVSTYLLGNSTVQFSLTIGLFMSAYGLGSFASARIKTRLVPWFVATEIALGFLGGISAMVLFYLYGTSSFFEVGRVGLILSMGTLIGLEVPLLLRISESYRQDLRVSVGQIMGFDYIGALIGGVGFPLLLLPAWGLVGSASLIGVLNALVALFIVYAFRDELQRVNIRWLVAAAALSALILSVVAYKTHDVERYLESTLYEDKLTYLEQSPYQRLVLTRRTEDTRLYLDGSLQFSSIDEYRYHESLVHPAASRLDEVNDVLVLGGGDGLVLRELIAHDPRRVVVVDLDPAMTRLGSTNEVLTTLNKRAFERLNVEVVNEDAFVFLERDEAVYDLIIVDLPDPHHESLAKLYSVSFYSVLKKRLNPEGLAALQLGSPFFANRTFWSSVSTLERAGLNVRPYSANVPSFGIWGFVLAGHGEIVERPVREIEGRFYDAARDAQLFDLPRDLLPQHSTEPNTLVRPVIVEYFRRDWRSWN